MQHETPTELIVALIDARSRGDIEAVVCCYETTAAIVPSPGQIQTGEPALRTWLASFAALQPKFVVTDRQIIEADGIALHCSAWKLSGIDPTGKAIELGGRSTDILRKQAGGGWLVALDNPWGTASLDPMRRPK